jgi:hypothetical protein
MVSLLNVRVWRRQLEFLLIFYTGHTRDVGDRWPRSVGHLACDDAERTENLMDLHSRGAQLVSDIINAIQMIVVNGYCNAIGHAVPSQWLVAPRTGRCALPARGVVLLGCLDEAGAYVDGGKRKLLGGADQLPPQRASGRARCLRVQRGDPRHVRGGHARTGDRVVAARR